MGIRLNEPEGDEMSAFGVGFNAGGVAFTTVPENSEAARMGFRTGDLIQEINGIKIKNIQNLINCIHQKKSLSEKHTFVVIRNQAITSFSTALPLTDITQLP